MKTHRYEQWLCRCGHPLDTAAPTDDNPEPPKRGDVTLCLHCAEIYVMHDRGWQPITDDELIDMPLEQKKEISRVQTTLRSFIKSWKEGS
jgi:hypothetical protein